MLCNLRLLPPPSSPSALQFGWVLSTHSRKSFVWGKRSFNESKVNCGIDEKLNKFSISFSRRKSQNTRKQSPLKSTHQYTMIPTQVVLRGEYIMCRFFIVQSCAETLILNVCKNPPFFLMSSAAKPRKSSRKTLRKNVLR